MIINIYWNDLSDTGKETLIDNGFTPSPMQDNDDNPIGIIDTEQRAD